MAGHAPSGTTMYTKMVPSSQFQWLPSHHYCCSPTAQTWWTILCVALRWSFMSGLHWELWVGGKHKEYFMSINWSCHSTILLWSKLCMYVLDIVLIVYSIASLPIPLCFNRPLFLRLPMRWTTCTRSSRRGTHSSKGVCQSRAIPSVLWSCLTCCTTSQRTLNRLPPLRHGRLLVRTRGKHCPEC